MNLNPKYSGTSLTDIIEGKYSPIPEDIKPSERAPGVNDDEETRPNYKREHNEKLSAKSINQSLAQETNLFGKISHCDLDQVDKYVVLDPLAIHQEPNLDRKIDLLPLPPPSQYQVTEPSVPNPFEDTSWLAFEIEKLLKKESRMTTSLFKFKVNPKAARLNFNQLAGSNFDLESFLNLSERCATSYGSEFKEPSELNWLLSKHPRWKDLKEKLEKGCKYHLEDLPEDDQVQDLHKRVRGGNHKSAAKYDSFLSNAMKKEVEKGWALIIPDNDALKIPLIEIAQLGVAEHLGISEEGTYVPKLHLTHDLSFPGVISAESINSRIDRERLEPIMLGHCLLHILHQIVALPMKYPDRKNFIRKEDLKSAYRRMHLEAKSAILFAVRVQIENEWYVLISLRLPFGGSSCPPDFCLMLDVIWYVIAGMNLRYIPN